MLTESSFDFFLSTLYIGERRPKTTPFFRRIIVRKKSHVLLGKCLADQLDSRDLRFHKKAFCYGNVLPDLRPSFVTVRHEYHVNFDMVCDKIKKLAEDCTFLDRYTSGYWMKMGEVAHYVADYFTFPHNAHYTGSLVDHTYYEGDLKNKLKEYILGGHAGQHCEKEVSFDSFEEVIAFIKKAHAIYEMKERSVEEDIQFIISVTYQVIQGVIHLMEAKFAPEMEPVFA